MSLLNLNKKLENLQEVPEKNTTRSGGFKKGKKVWILTAIIIVLILVLGVYIPARGVYQSAKRIIYNSKTLTAAAKQNNFDQMKSAMQDTKLAVNDLNNSLNYFNYLSFVPFISGYYNDIRHVIKASGYELEAANTIVNSLEPYKGELGLTGQVTPGQDKIAQGVKILGKVLPDLNKIEPNLKSARSEMEQVDTSKYPEKYGTHVLRSNLEAVKGIIIGADIAVSENRDLITRIPSALGADSPKTYLMLFQNDKELRATGGFITAYSFLKLDKGHLSTTSSDDIYHLDEDLLKACQYKICPLTPPAAIIAYLPELSGKPRTAWSMRDSNFSPDLPTSAAQFEKMYSFLNTKTSFDGIITIDTQVVQGLIAFTGPITIGPITYSNDIDERCHCANVIYELEHYAEVASQGQAGRKEVLGSLMQQILSRVLGTRPDKFSDLVNTGIGMANHKDIMFYMHDPVINQGLTNLGWTGAIKHYTGDYLHINDSNFAGGKSNIYVTETVTDDIKIGSGGEVLHQLTIRYENPEPFNVWLNGILRDYVRVYTPQDSKFVDSKGSEVAVTSVQDKDLAKTYFDAFIQVRPQNYRILSFNFTSPVKVSGNNYHLLVQKQPGAKDHHYIIKINGQVKSEFTLTGDKELNLTF